MIRLLFLVLALFILGMYLNRAYANFYETRENYILTPPPFKEKVYLGNHASMNEETYVAIGDSLTAGTGATSYKTTFAYLFASRLAENSYVHLVNKGISGITTKEYLELEIQDVLEQKPTVVTVFLGINDIHNLTSPEEFKESYTQILENLTYQKDINIVLINLPKLGAHQILLFPYNYLLDLRTTQFNSIIAELGNKYGVTVIDLYSVTNAKFDEQDYSLDQFHPNDKGYKLWGEVIHAN